MSVWLVPMKTNGILWHSSKKGCRFLILVYILCIQFFGELIHMIGVLILVENFYAFSSELGINSLDWGTTYPMQKRSLSRLKNTTPKAKEFGGIH